MTQNLVLINPIIGPHLPRQLYEIGLAQTGCSGTYRRLMSYDYKIIQNVKQKWEEVLNDEITYLTVEKAFRDISKMKESAYYKYLQFKLLHSRTIINAKLLVMNISDSNICKVCMVEIETLKHVFIECTHVRELWSQVERWIRSNISRQCKISDIDKIFGQASKGDIINKIITATKAIIYNNRKTGKKHKINDIKTLLFHQLRTEEYEATLNQNEEYFFNTWGNIYIELITLYSA